MGRLVVNLGITLDGVTQAPGRLDEDTRNGFTHGGWAGPYFDPVMAEEAGPASEPQASVADPSAVRRKDKGMAQQPALLFGRRTYEDFYKVWPGRTDGNMFTEVLNNATKYVASRTLKEPLPWMNSTLLQGDTAEAVAKLKRELGKDILILGSVSLVRSLMPYHVIDEYALSIHPLLLGTGFRLFNEGSPFTSLRLVDSKTTTTGVVLARYSPKDDGG